MENFGTPPNSTWENKKVCQELFCWLQYFNKNISLLYLSTSWLCPTVESGLLMSSLYKEINALYAGMGMGGEGNARGAKTVDFKHETWVDGEFAAMKRDRLVSYFS